MYYTIIIAQRDGGFCQKKKKNMKEGDFLKRRGFFKE